MSVGRMVCSFPCLGRNATVLPPNSPIVMASEGLPYGVSTVISWMFLRSLGSYRPVPPITPNSACMKAFTCSI